MEVSFGAFAHKIGELGTEVCCTQRLYVRSGRSCQSLVASLVGKMCHQLASRDSTPSSTRRWPRSRIKLNMDVNFRKIDIDAYDEDVLLETELYDPDPRRPQQALEDAKARAASVRTALAK